MTRLRVTVIVIALLLFGFALWWNNGKSAVNPSNTTQIPFIIKPYENVRDIASNLKNAGLIKDPIIFFLTIRQLGLDGKIQAGNFHLSSSMTADQIAQALTHGTTDTQILFKEGLRATEIDEILQKNISTYDPSWKNALITNEGYLFPDTYSFPVQASIDQIIAIMRDNFNKKYLLATANQTVKMSQNDAVILASIVEKEGRTDDEMKLVASVLENRLDIGMALQTDATIQYALGYSAAKKTWWPQITGTDINIDSPYNTYKNPGLPPTPISNPGLTALSAVLHPANTNYMYYFTDPKGITHFAKTLQEQNINIAKYSQ
ncbi:MAG: endolytic transglycosylase MltG [Patescibacteria group bacterium]|nr:endolytic transglycosylase MltG [Patescibacteria group bacterium]